MDAINGLSTAQLRVMLMQPTIEPAERDVIEARIAHIELVAAARHGGGTLEPHHLAAELGAVGAQVQALRARLADRTLVVAESARRSWQTELARLEQRERALSAALG